MIGNFGILSHETSTDTMPEMAMRECRQLTFLTIFFFFLALLFVFALLLLVFFDLAIPPPPENWVLFIWGRVLLG